MATKKTKTRGRPTLRALLLKARIAGAKKGERPRTMAWLAEKCGVERTYLYAITAGAKTPSDDIVKRIAKGTGQLYRTVAGAL